MIANVVFMVVRAFVVVLISWIAGDGNCSTLSGRVSGQALHGFDVPVPDCERIRAVHGAMVELGLASVSEFAERAGLSVRALERICRRHFGFPPKLLLRRQRFMRSLAAWMLGGMGRWSPAITSPRSC